MGEEVLSVSHHQRITTSELSHPEIEEKSTNHLSRRQVKEMDNRRSSEIVVDVQRTIAWWQWSELWYKLSRQYATWPDYGESYDYKWRYRQYASEADCWVYVWTVDRRTSRCCYRRRSVVSPAKETTFATRNPSSNPLPGLNCLTIKLWSGLCDITLVCK